MRTPHHGGYVIATHAVFGVYSTVAERDLHPFL